MPFKTSRVGDALLAQYQQDPRYLMALQGMQQGGSTAPVHSAAEGIARALQAPLAAYTAKNLQGEYQGKQDEQYGAIADILAPNAEAQTVKADLGQLGTLDASLPALANPNREKIMGALQSGLITPSAIGPSVVDALGFGKSAEYDTTPRTGINPTTNKREQFVMDKQGNVKWLGVSPETKAEFVNGRAVDPFNTQPGYQVPDTMTAEAEAQKTRIAAAGKPVTNVNVNANKPFAAELGGNAAKILDSSAAAARSGIETITTVNQIKDALATGKVTAGPGTTAIQFFNQVSGGDPQKLAATRATIQGLSKLTLAARGALKGQGQVSDYEGKLLARASSGEIDGMTIPEIEVVTNVADRLARAAIRSNRANVEKARRVPGSEDVIDFYNVDEPPAYVGPKKKSGRFTIEAQ